MKKKLLILALTIMTSGQLCFAQFEQGKKYVGASLSGFDFRYDATNKLSLGVRGKVGYFIVDDWLLTADVDFQRRHNVPNSLSASGGVRYYIEQNGLYLGGSVKYVHYNGNHDDIMPSAQIGYAFFISHTVTVEPEIYYDQSTQSHSRYSGFGVRIGFGVYL